jgi:flagellar hook-associated protein 2
MADGTEKLIETPGLFTEDSAVDIAVKDYDGITAIRIKNANTGKQLDVSAASSYDSGKSLGYQPKNPVSEADDAILKYEGIQITRAKNDIDDIVPEITLHVHDKTEKAATISVKPDKEASKDALIQFVGQYNRTIAELNILSQNKEEIISELDYLTNDEREAEMKKLGMFITDFTLPTIKSNMASIITAGYRTSDQATITMLSQIGISTNASGGNGSYSQSRLRGYLEIDEKKLDQAIDNHLDDIKMLFGYDSDGDLISDSGIGVQLDKQIAAYTQTGGILSLKNSGLDSKIKASEQRIARLETQMDRKEAELRNKYGQMEGSLNSLESQQNSINNFTNQQNRNR